jgi:ABC-type lipoprotein release transport system permease subunit
MLQMDTLRQDIRFAWRTFRKNPAFTVVAVLTLALGIGANTAIFSVVNAVLIRSLPYEQPESLVVLWGNVQRTVVERRGTSFPDYTDWRAQNRSFEDLAAYSDATFTLTSGDEPERIGAEEVTPSYLRLLRVQPIAGRLFTEEEGKPGAALTAILGHGLWTRRFGGNPDIVGTTVSLSGRSFTVIGVLPRGFRGLTDQADLWVTPAIERPQVLTNRGSRGFPALGRLKPGVTLAAAQADLTQVCRNLERAYPATNEKRGVELTPLTTELFGEIREALQIVLGAVGLVLLIACANVAGLLLARAETRQREMAVRTAMGAGRGRLLQQLVIEGLFLTVAAGVAGILISRWVADALVAFSPVTFPGFVTVNMDHTVLLFTLTVSTLLGLLLGVAPMWQISHATSVSSTLKEAGRGTAGGGRLLFRQLIVTAEVALAVILLVGAGLLIRSLLALNALDPGFTTERLLTLRVSLPDPPAPTSAAAAPATMGAAPAAATIAAAAPAETAAASQAALAMLERLASVPGVERVGAGSAIPLSGGASAIFFTAQDQPPVTAQNIPRAYTHRVSPGFFQTLGIELVAGREFVPADLLPQDTISVIVSEGVVKRFWPNQDPIGKRLKPGGPASKASWLTVVGVVRDTRYRALPRNPTLDPDLFFPLRPQSRNFALFVRTRVAPEALIETVRREIRALEPGATLYDVATMEERVGRQTARPRFVSWLMGVFACLALLLAAIGVYGVLAQSVARRTQEISVRMALGAGRAQILGLVLRRGLGLVGIGLAVGGLGAVLLTRLIRTQIYGVSQTDPVTFVGVMVLLGAVALVATWIPARRATRVDPLVALRYE